MNKAAPGGRKEAITMRQVDGGTFLNEPNIGRIVETLRQIFNEGKAKECGAVLAGATVARKDAGEMVSPLAPEVRETA